METIVYGQEENRTWEYHHAVPKGPIHKQQITPADRCECDVVRTQSPFSSHLFTAHTKVLLSCIYNHLKLVDENLDSKSCDVSDQTLHE